MASGTSRLNASAPRGRFSFDQIREAQRLMESNQATGKIVVKL
jgi:hypothetical protein